jgi:hypothetical protein
MKKIVLFVALFVALFASAQTKQYFWLDGKLMFGTQIASTDSLTYGREEADSMMLYLPRTVTKIVTVHDTITQTVTVHDTVTQLVHDTITQTVTVHDTTYLRGKDPTNNPVRSGLFSVSATTQVQFAPGNLQYKASTGTWRFAEEQYDMIGLGNARISTTYSDWMDLFGWGTGNNPTLTSTSNSDYSTFVDWGTNPISNGGSTANTWRTLTKDEWGYLFNTRANASSLYGQGNINGINGTIILPDSWTTPSGTQFVAQMGFTANIYSKDQWELMEAAGAIFLPAAGDRSGTSVTEVGTYGYYWSSTMNSSSRAYHIFYTDGRLRAQDYDRSLYEGLPVRLVR